MHGFLHREARWLALGLALFAVTACGARAPATSLPAGFNLTGTWALLAAESDIPPTLIQLRARGGWLHLVVQDFPIIAAQRVRIEQDASSMGMSFDDGAWRDVSWGERERGLWTIQAGWLEDGLVILSRAEDASARETYQQSADGRQLTVRIELEAGGEDILLRRVYQRINDDPSGIQ
jgi:hypothetical protein